TCTPDLACLCCQPSRTRECPEPAGYLTPRLFCPPASALIKGDKTHVHPLVIIVSCQRGDRDSHATSPSPRALPSFPLWTRSPNVSRIWLQTFDGGLCAMRRRCIGNEVNDVEFAV